MIPLDFVLLWVDGSDPAWRTEKRKWEAAAGIAGAEAGSRLGEEANGEIRYKDQGLLRYWFRAVERYAPWVRRVFFVTCGQRPAWLDETCPKLRLVNHDEFIPADCLPTFNSNAIHFFLHRIPDLSERFVLFDDDMFLLRPVEPGHYFQSGLPVLAASLRLPRWKGDTLWNRTLWDNSYEVNVHLDVARGIRENARKWFNPFVLGPRLALGNFARFLLNANLPCSPFGHLPYPHLKSTFGEVWRHCPETLQRTVRERFRTPGQVTQWLVLSWNQATGRFHPKPNHWRDGVYNVSRRGLERILDAVRSPVCSQACFQEVPGESGLASCFAELRKAFGERLPERSSFERDLPAP